MKERRRKKERKKEITHALVLRDIFILLIIRYKYKYNIFYELEFFGLLIII